MSRPNVILICVDQMRGDAMSAAGHPVVQTPHLDALAREGTMFSHAYSATPSCIPARAALLAGQSQERHGRFGYRDGLPFHELYPTTVASVLGSAGYQTQAIGKMHVFPERSRCGFDNVLLHDGYLHFNRRGRLGELGSTDDYVRWLRMQPGSTADADYFDNGVGCNSVVARPWDQPERLHPTNWAVTEAVEWLGRRDPTAPFFLYLSFHRPHAPYDPPRWAFEQYLSQVDTNRPMGDWVEKFASHRSDGYHLAEFAEFNETIRARAMAGYYGNISHIDLQLNRLFEALVDNGVSDDTAIVFTSDHGEMLGDHGMYRKQVGYEGSARVPLIVTLPRRMRSGRVRGTSDAVAELRDVMPTILEITGTEIPDTVDGRSLLPFLKSETAETADGWRSEIHGEHVHFGESWQWVTDGRRKFMWTSGDGVEQFFNLEEDPNEIHDLIDSDAHAAEIVRWRACLVKYLRDRSEGYVRDGRLVTGADVLTEAEWVSVASEKYRDNV